MKTLLAILTVAALFVAVTITGFKSGLVHSFGKHFQRPVVYVVSDTLAGPEDQWEIKDGKDADGNWMPYSQVVALVENKGNYEPQPVPLNWIRP